MANRRYDYYGASGVIDRVDDYLFDDELLLVAEDGANLVLRNLPLAVIARGKFWVNNHAHVLKPRSGSTEYFAGLVEAMDLKPWITGAAQPKLTQERLMAIRVPVPPESEQVEIAAWIKSRTTDSDRGIERARQEIALLREYRARLIADAVTGKVDVRDAAARLPDEVDDPEPLDEVDLEGTDEPELDDLDLVEA
jgi:type I restriction enzyme S subunit